MLVATEASPYHGKRYARMRINIAALIVGALFALSTGFAQAQTSVVKLACSSPDIPDYGYYLTFDSTANTVVMRDGSDSSVIEYSGRMTMTDAQVSWQWRLSEGGTTSYAQYDRNSSRLSVQSEHGTSTFKCVPWTRIF